VTFFDEEISALPQISPNKVLIKDFEVIVNATHSVRSGSLRKLNVFSNKTHIGIMLKS